MTKLFASIFVLAILAVTYAWCRWGAGQWGFSPLIQLGQTSLLVYWVHIEFVYGRVSILPKHAVGMLLLSVWRTRWKRGGGESLFAESLYRKVRQGIPQRTQRNSLAV